MGLLEPARRSLPVPRPGRAIAAIHLPAVSDLDVDGKRVLVRADLNVPLEDQRITDDFRIRAFEPTLKRLQNARVIACSHFGRPKGPDEKYSLKLVADELGVPLVTDYGNVPDEPVVLLENLRFHPGETKNDPAFVDQLVALADAYVNDAFGSCHRAHASIVGVPSRLPSAAGPLLESEVAHLSRLLEAPEHPYVVVLGGSKVSDKIGVVQNLLDKADAILVGGGMCFTFLKAAGAGIGKSLLDEEHLKDVAELLENEKIVLPTDVVVADAIDAKSGDVVEATAIPDDRLGVDIGPESAKAFAEKITTAKTVFWNGPMGVFENDAFAAGTKTVADGVASTDGYTVIGGGDVVAAIAKFGLTDAIDFVSTGGGASLEFLEGKELPGIAALKKGN